MSLSRLPLPSISRVLESKVDISANNASSQENSDASMTSGSQASEVPSPAVVPQIHQMKTVDFRNNDLENEEVELFFLKVGFPDEAQADKDDPQTIFEERRQVDVAHIAHLQEAEKEPAPHRWLHINFSQFIVAIRRLFPFRLVEVLLRKAGRELAQYFALR